MELRDIDLTDRDEYSRRVPHDWFEHLRRTAPVYKHPEPGGPGFWVFTRHEDVSVLTRDWERFSSDQDLGGVIGLEDLDPAVRTRTDEARAGAKMMLHMDPPAHTRYRKLVNRTFTPRAIRPLEDHLRALSAETIERALATDGGRCDFVVDVASKLPLDAIAEFVGVPPEDRHKLVKWSNHLAGSDDPEYAVDAQAVNEARAEMYAYANALGRDRRENPRDDIASDLVHGEVDGDALSDLDFNYLFLLLIVAGNETTRNTLSHGMLALLQNPDQYDRLVEHPELLETTATEEILRWASPVLYFRRNVTRDLDYKGHHIAEGDKASLWFVSANYDEDVFDDPHRFDLGRDPNPHVAFGGGGPHHCLGAHLARLEIKVLFQELVRRVPRVEQLGEPARLRSSFVNGIKHLPVRLVPGG